MQEFLVVISCLNAKGCNETSNAYYESHPQLKEMIQTNEKKVREFVGPVIVETAGPVFFVIAGGSGNIKLYKDLSLKFDKNSQGLLYSVGF